MGRRKNEAIINNEFYLVKLTQSCSSVLALKMRVVDALHSHVGASREHFEHALSGRREGSGRENEFTGRKLKENSLETATQEIIYPAIKIHVSCTRLHSLW